MTEVKINPSMPKAASPYAGSTGKAVEGSESSGFALLLRSGSNSDMQSQKAGADGKESASPRRKADSANVPYEKVQRADAKAKTSEKAERKGAAEEDDAEILKGQSVRELELLSMMVNTPDLETELPLMDILGVLPDQAVSETAAVQELDDAGSLLEMTGLMEAMQEMAAEDAGAVSEDASPLAAGLPGLGQMFAQVLQTGTGDADVPEDAAPPVLERILPFPARGIPAAKAEDVPMRQLDSAEENLLFKAMTEALEEDFSEEASGEALPEGWGLPVQALDFLMQPRQASEVPTDVPADRPAVYDTGEAADRGNRGIPIEAAAPQEAEPRQEAEAVQAIAPEKLPERPRFTTHAEAEPEKAIADTGYAERAEQVQADSGEGRMPVRGIGEAVPERDTSSLAKGKEGIVPEESRASQAEVLADLQAERPVRKAGQEPPRDSDDSKDTAPDDAGKLPADLVRKAERQPRKDGHAGEEHAEGGENQTAAHASLAAAQAMPERGHVQETGGFLRQMEGAVPLQTSEASLPTDLADLAAARMSRQNQELVIELEPRSLGQITLRLHYDGNRASLSILAQNPKTLALLSTHAGEMAKILEQKTGDQTVVYVPSQETPAQEQDLQNQQGGWSENQQEAARRWASQNEERQKRGHSESFLQQMRLGLV